MYVYIYVYRDIALNLILKARMNRDTYMRDVAFYISACFFKTKKKQVS
jgi:hypothetical protein